LNWVIKDCSARRVDIVGLSPALIGAFNTILIIFLHFLLDVEDVGLTFRQNFVAFWDRKLLVGLLHS
jgi:hypothetical protein